MEEERDRKKERREEKGACSAVHFTVRRRGEWFGKLSPPPSIVTYGALLYLFLLKPWRRRKRRRECKEKDSGKSSFLQNGGKMAARVLGISLSLYFLKLFFDFCLIGIGLDGRRRGAMFNLCRNHHKRAREREREGVSTSESEGKGNGFLSLDRTGMPFII